MDALQFHAPMVILSAPGVPCSSKKPFGIFLSTDVTRAFLWFLNL